MQRTGLGKFVQSVAALFLAFSQAAASEHRGVIRFNELPVPGATVTARQGEKKLTITTDLQGMYFFPDLTDGTWAIEVDMLGFHPIRGEIRIGQERPELVWDMTMLPLPEIKTEFVNPVSLGAPAEFQRADVNRLPEASDTPLEAARAAPVSFSNLNDEQLSERAADGFLVNASINNGAASPFAHAAAFGNNRRGDKSIYRGNLGIVADNSAFDARPFSLTGQNTPKPDYSNSQISITIGGPLNIPPLLRNGPNFFLGYQRIRGRNATVQTSRMPTSEERKGDLSGIRNPPGQPIQIFDPDTSEPFDKNVIPEDRISPQAKSLLSLYPFPNTSDGGRYNYQVPIVAATHQDSFQGQLSRGLRINGYLSGRFNYQTIRTDNPNAFAFLDTGRDSSLDVAAGYSINFNRLLSANLRYQFQRTTNRTTPNFANRTNVSGDMGISGNNQEPRNWGPPNLSFQNYERLTDTQNSFDRNQTNGVNASIQLNHRDHSFKFGVDFRRQQINLLSQQDARGTFTFTGAATGYDFADFLLGIPDASSIAFGNADKYFRASRYAAYINDDWRLSSGFTLNAGVRWEYEAPMTELYGRLVNLDITHDFSNAVPITAGNPTGLLTNRQYPDSLVNPDKGGIQPRIGFAWRPMASSMVIRGGYGIYRDTSVYRPIALQMAQQSPFSKSMTVGNSLETPLTLADGFNIFPQDLMNTFAIDPGFRVAVAQNWQASIQRDLPMSLQMVIMYLGAKGSHLIQKSLPNTHPEGAVNSCAICPSGFIYEGSNGSSIRHAGQIQLRRRLRNRLAAEIRYVFSKSIDDAALGISQGGGTTVAQNWLDLRAERALSNFDQRHLLNFQAQYTAGSGGFHSVPFSGWRGAILKEWTFAGQLMLGSGLPLTPVYPIAMPGTGFVGSIRPSRTAAPITGTPAGLFLNPAAYAPAPAGEWGNAGRNSITGPNQFSLDVSLGRTFRLRDLFIFDFRLDGSNILNHVTFPNWNTTINSSQFGLPDRSNPMRKVRANLRVSF